MNGRAGRRGGDGEVGGGGGGWARLKAAAGAVAPRAEGVALVQQGK